MSTSLEFGRVTNEEELLDRAEPTLGRVEQTIDNILVIARLGRVEHPGEDPPGVDVEASYESLDDAVAKLILEGTKSVNGNTADRPGARHPVQEPIVHSPESVRVRVDLMNGGLNVRG